MAEANADLEAVTRAAQSVIDDVVSIGMSLDTCTVPGSPKEDRIAAGKAELGLGIHGEPGVEQVAFEGARSAMQMVVDRLAQGLGDGPYVALLNNLGSATPLEMSVLAEELCRSAIGARVQSMIGPAPLMTSLDMHGFSLSLLPVDEDIRAPALAQSVAPDAWPGCHAVVAPPVLAMPVGMAPETFAPSQDAAMGQLLDICCAELKAAEADRWTRNPAMVTQGQQLPLRLTLCWPHATACRWQTARRCAGRWRQS